MRIFRSTALPERFTITYDPNGGSFDGSTSALKETYKKGTVISIHEAPVREGYTFKYWKGSEYRPGDRYTVTGDHTFAACWEENGRGTGGDGSGKGNGDRSSGTRTGDGARPGIWAAFALLAALGMAVMAVMRRRR